MNFLQANHACTPAKRTCGRRFGVALVAYIVLLPGVKLYFNSFHPSGVAAYLLALLPALAILAQLLAVTLYVAEEKDEFLRFLFLQGVLWGVGGVLAVTSVWGMLEAFDLVRHFQPIWTYSVFWAFVGISYPVAVRRYR